jgi:hypothetical protein
VAVEGHTVIRFRQEAQEKFDRAAPETKADATPALELLSTGFEISWFNQAAYRIWTAVIKPNEAVAEHFGLRLECFAIGHGFPKDFHEKTLLQQPPAEINFRLDPQVRVVVSNAPLAGASCAAWAARHKKSIVLIAPSLRTAEASQQDYLYKQLSTALWRRDLFAESEPVRLPSEFFGREAIVNEVLAHIIGGTPVGVFGLRKIGKSSLLGRVEDLLEADEGSLTASVFLLGNSARLRGGRWWTAASDMLNGWQNKLARFATRIGSATRPKAEAMSAALANRANLGDNGLLATAFGKDVGKLLKAAAALAEESGRPAFRLVCFLDECDLLYPHRDHAGNWREDFFVFWNTLQTTKRALECPDQLVYVLGGVNPSGVERGSLLGEQNPLFETVKVYLKPMPRDEAAGLLKGLGSRMGLIFTDEAVDAAYALVGGHPRLLRNLGSEIHKDVSQRGATAQVGAGKVQSVFKRTKRSFFAHIEWILEHLKTVAPDEEKLLRDVAVGGPQVYLDVWGDHDYRETFAYHLEQYGLVEFEDDLPRITIPLIADAIRKPAPSEFEEQFETLKDMVDAVEDAIRRRLAADLAVSDAEADGGGQTPQQALFAIVNAIPGEAKNRSKTRQQLIDIGEAAGIPAVMDSLNWNDYEILINKFYDRVAWFGAPMDKEQRLRWIHDRIAECHLFRHNNRAEVRAAITKDGYPAVHTRISSLRDLVAG